MIWALTRIQIRLPEGHKETDDEILKKDGKHWFIAEVFGDDERRPFSFTNWDWWRAGDLWTLILYWRDLLAPVLTFPEDFTGKPNWDNAITFGMSEKTAKELWDNPEDEFWNDVKCEYPDCCRGSDSDCKDGECCQAPHGDE